MKLETFFEKFELFAEAPDAVAKMRELVLQLAVTGRLVAQDKLDEPASVLLKSAKSERAKLVAAKKIKSRPTPSVELDEQPFELPTSWEWARLSDVGYELGQKVPDKRFTYIDVGGIDPKKGLISDRVKNLDPADAPSRARKLVTRGTVIYSTVRPYLLNIAIVEQDFDPEPIASTAFGILHPFSGINNRYLFYWLRSAPFTAYVEAGMKGMAYPAINDEKFYSGYIPVPPLAEQKRIVAKVDELMALCDRLEAQQQACDSANTALARVSLARFAEAPTPANLQLLFHPSYSISPADLRKSILTLAVQGELVPQDSNEEPVDELISQISAEQDRLVRALKIRRPDIAPLTEDEQPFSIPSTWTWVRLGNIGDWGSGSTPPRGNHELYGGSIPWLKSGELNDNQKLVGSEEKVTELATEACSFRKNKPGDVLLAMYGATIGKAAILAEPAVTNQAVCGCTPFSGVLNTYLFNYLLSQRDSFHALSEGGAQPNISKVKIIGYPFPLPPLGEQRRIVAKVDQLMALVDQLEVQLATAKEKGAALLGALIHESLNRSAEVIDLANYRAAVGCKVIRKMEGKPYFGRTAAMKALYLAEAHAGLPLGLKPMREAAGPLDQWIYRFEEEGVRSGWFSVVEKSTTGDRTKTSYQPGRALANKCAQVTLKPVQQKELDRVLSLLADKTTEEAEIIATLFAAWNDFLIDGHSPSDDEIVREVRENWHEKKGRFTPTKLRQWLDWLRENNLVPKGRPPRTIQQTQLILN